MVALIYLHQLPEVGILHWRHVSSFSRTKQLLGTHGKTDLVIGVGKETRIDSEVTGKETDYPDI